MAKRKTNKRTPKKPAPSILDRRFEPIARRLKANGVSKNDIAIARSYYERRVLQKGAALDTTERGAALAKHQGFYFYERHTQKNGKTRKVWYTPDGSKRVPPSVAKRENTKRSRPSPKNGAYRYNDAYRLNRGYHHKDAKGRWRTPDGRKIVPESVAKRRNRKHHERLVVYDSYYSLLSRGLPVDKRDFRRAAKNGKFTREGLRESTSGVLANAFEKQRRTQERRKKRGDLGEDPRGDLGPDAYAGAPEELAEDPEAVLDRRGLIDEWFEDYEDMDTGDTP